MIRHDFFCTTSPVLPLTSAMICARFGTFPVAAIGAAMLPQPGSIAAGPAAVELSPVTAGADKEHRLAFAANPLPENHIALRRHAPSLAGLDNAMASWHLEKQLRLVT
jgi:hypothetical protein